MLLLSIELAILSGIVGGLLQIHFIVEIFKTLELCPDYETVYGFWSGLLHGLFWFPNWIMSWSFDSIDVYANNNSGIFYLFGFTHTSVSSIGLVFRLVIYSYSVSISTHITKHYLSGKEQ